MDNIDEEYDETMELFGGTIPEIGEPVEYITTDAHLKPSLSEEHAKELIEKYGHTELHSTVDDDMDDFKEDEDG